MKYRLILTKRFEKDVKRCVKRGLPMEKFKKVIRLLEETGKLPSEYRPHKLSGQYAGKWECHILPMRCLGLRRNFSDIVRKIKLALAGKAGELPNFIPTRLSYSDFKHSKNSKSYDKTKG